MSRAIPRVKRWRVKYWRAGAVVFSHESMAPAKIFAQWNAHDAYVASGAWRTIGLNVDRITIGLTRNQESKP